MKNIIILIILTTFFVSSCSKAPGKSEAKFRMGISAIMDITTVGAGGAMLWGRADNGEMFGAAITPAVPLDLVLSNGNWTFWSVAWEGDGSGDKFSGTVRCAKTGAALNGSDVQVNISLNNETCALNDFTPTTSTTAGFRQFPDIRHHECQKITDHNGRGCGANEAGVKTVSRRFVLASFRKPKDAPMIIAGPAIVSACYAAGLPFIKEHLPLGNGFLPAMTFLESFYSSVSCDLSDPKGVRRASYEYGLNGTARLDTIKFTNEGICSVATIPEAQCSAFGGNFSTSCTMTTAQTKDISQTACTASGGTYTFGMTKNFQLVQSISDGELCSGPRSDLTNTSPHPFASGNGTPAAPYTICRETQLNRIGENGSTYMTSYFNLAANLDMNMTSLFGNQAAPACLASDPGANFVMIGTNYSACLDGAALSFSGVFNGNNYSISNIRVHKNSLDHVAFVRMGGTIKNLVFNDPEFEGNNYVAVVSGAGSVIKNVTVEGAKIRGNSYIAAIAGSYSSSAEFVNNHASKTDIVGKAYGGYLGGLIGVSTIASALVIKKSSFKGHLRSYGSDEAIGGLIGYRAGGGVTIEESFTNGALFTSGTAGNFAGGFVGYSNALVTINKSYSRMNIASSGNQPTYGAASLGGLVGSATSLSLNYAYYFGSILHPCFEASATACAASVGTLAGNITPAGGTYRGAMLHTNYTSTVLRNNVAEITLKDTTFLNSLMANGFRDVGASLPKLSWEQDTCSYIDNNTSIAIQVSSPLSRGTVASNPVIICNEDQWNDIKNNSTLHFSLGDNIALSNTSYSEAIANFSGTLNGNENLVSGFYINVGTSGTGSLFNTVSGTIKNVHFAAGHIKTSTGSSLGITGTLLASGVIENSHFTSVTLKGQTPVAGVVAATNAGTINRVVVNSHVETMAGNMGIMSGINATGATISRSRIEGRVNILNVGGTVRVGGVVGINHGTISEVDTSAEVINNLNTETSSFVGTFAGENNGHVQDILLRPYAKLKIGLSGINYYGHVFGSTTNSSTAARIVAANELAVDSTYNSSSRVLNFSSYSNHFATNYNHVFSMDGAVFNFNNIARAINSCSLTGGTYTYTAVSAFTKTLLDGFFISNYNSGLSGISSRFTGTHTNATSGITSIVGTNLNLPCSPSGLQPGTNFYEIQQIPNHSNINHISPASFSVLSTFCPAGLDGTGRCLDPDQFDIVEDSGGAGFNRVLTAYSQWLSTGQPPTSYPVWTTGDQGYPKLFIVD